MKGVRQNRMHVNSCTERGEESEHHICHGERGISSTPISVPEEQGSIKARPLRGLIRANAEGFLGAPNARP